MEMVELVKGLSTSFAPRIYVIADSDERSEHKVLELEKQEVNTSTKENQVRQHSLTFNI